MARPADPRTRARLRAKAAEYVLANGLGDLTLRPLAKVLKTSARMLVYHFGSREGLLREILGYIRDHEDARIQSWFASAKTPPTMSQFLGWLWKEYAVPPRRPALRLLFELYALALRNPRKYPGVLETPFTYWHKLSGKTGIATSPDGVEATLLLAATRGLLLDYCATGDYVRGERAMKALAQFVEWRVTSVR